MGLIDGAWGAVTTLALGDYNRARQEDANMRETRRQIEGTKELTDYQKDADFNIANRLSLPWQVQKAKEAGLNPATLYGKGGTGGITTGGSGQMPTRGQVPDANAATANQLNAMLTTSQIKLLDAQADKAQADADKARGVDTENVRKDTDLKGTQIENLTQGIENQKAQKTLTSAQTNIAELEGEYLKESMNYRLDMVAQEANIALGKAESALAQGNVDEETVWEKIQILKNQAISSALQITAQKAEIKLTQEQTWKIAQDVTQKWQELNQNRAKNEYEHSDRLKAIEEFTKNALKVAGIQAAGNVISTVANIATKQPPIKGGWKETHTELPDGNTTNKYETWGNR